MKCEDLEQALGATPRSFAEKMETTLCGLKEEKEMKRATFRTVLIAAIVTVLLCSTAFALVGRGLEWYYNNRFTAYQKYEPEKHEAIINGLQTQVPQARADDPDISIGVTDISWAPEKQLLVVSLAAGATDDAAVLYPMDHLDADGDDSREDHWLFTGQGFGPVNEMIGEGKQLLLLDAHTVCLDGLQLVGDGSSYDSYVAEDGTLYTVIEIRLDHLNPGYVEEQKAMLAQHPEQEFRRENIAVAQKLAELMEKADTMELAVQYTVTAYSADAAQLHNGGRQGEVTFTVELK